MAAYGIERETLRLIYPHLRSRKQCVKVNNTYSNYNEIISCVPQGSILRPILFNLFINDLFIFIEIASMHNFADDNSLSAWGEILSKLIGTLESVDWFTKNEMIINPDKFQAIILDKKKSNLTNTLLTEAVVRRCSVKKVFLEMSQNSQKHTCARVSFLIKLQASCNFIKKETLAQVFSCEFCEICKNTFFYRTPLGSASDFHSLTFHCIVFASHISYLGCSH